MKFLRLSPVKEVAEDAEVDNNSHLANTHPDVEQPAVTEPDDEEDEEVPELSLTTAIVLLAVVTALVAVTAEWLVGSIDGLTRGGRISKEFIGLVLLPTVSNAAEHATAVTVSINDKLSSSLGGAVRSSLVSPPPP